MWNISALSHQSQMINKSASMPSMPARCKAMDEWLRPLRSSCTRRGQQTQVVKSNIALEFFSQHHPRALVLRQKMRCYLFIYTNACMMFTFWAHTISTIYAILRLYDFNNLLDSHNSHNWIIYTIHTIHTIYTIYTIYTICTIHTFWTSRCIPRCSH